MKDSSFIKEVMWSNGNLFVRLKSGRFYEYENVPEQVYLDFINADSLGKFFGENIKDQYDYIPYIEPEVQVPKVVKVSEISEPARWPFPTSAKPK